MPFDGFAGFVKNIKMFNTSVPMFFDDVHRVTELRIMQQVAKRIGRPYETVKTIDKAFGVIK